LSESIALCYVDIGVSTFPVTEVHLQESTGKSLQFATMQMAICEAILTYGHRSIFQIAGDSVAARATP
jgi:hypothetical protein